MGGRGSSIMFYSNHWLIGVCVMDMSDEFTDLDKHFGKTARGVKLGKNKMSPLCGGGAIVIGSGHGHESIQLVVGIQAHFIETNL